MAHVLELKDVHAGYGRIEVLRDITLSVPEASVVALLGPNGAGKTTTLKLIAGTIPLMSGDLLLDGASIARRSSYERAGRGVVLVPEGRGVFPSLSVKDNLELIVRGSGCDVATRNERMSEVLSVFPRLEQRLKQRAGTLSGGEQQMLALSRAFLCSPRVLMMDEISMGLAPQLVSQLFEAVDVLRSRGMTIVLVEQFLAYALRFADVCYVLNKGQVSFVGEPSELRGGASMAFLSA